MVVALKGDFAAGVAYALTEKALGFEVTAGEVVFSSRGRVGGVAVRGFGALPFTGSLMAFIPEDSQSRGGKTRGANPTRLTGS